MMTFTFQDPEEEELFHYLYHKYHRLFYKVSFDILQNQQDVEDAIQTSLEIIYRYFYKIKNEVEKKCIGYMLMIIKNESIDLCNRRKKTIITDEVSDSRSYQSLNERESLYFQKQILKDAIKKLDEKYRNILILKYIYGYSNREIAEMLNLSETNVSTRLERARKQLKNQMNQGVDNHEN